MQCNFCKKDLKNRLYGYQLHWDCLRKIGNRIQLMKDLQEIGDEFMVLIPKDICEHYLNELGSYVENIIKT
jgi:hypothetical protein